MTKQKFAPVPGYESLEAVLKDAYDQAARGKGKERHAQDLPFDQQRMQSISSLLGSEKGMAYQVIKKITEGMDLPPEARERELLGAINYLAGMVIYYRARDRKPPRLPSRAEIEALLSGQKIGLNDCGN